MANAHALELGIINRMYILCDICAPIQVNATRMNILRMVVLDKQGPTVQLAFPLQLQKICKNIVNSIKIDVLEELNLPSEYLPIGGLLYVKLIFQQVE